MKYDPNKAQLIKDTDPEEDYYWIITFNDHYYSNWMPKLRWNFIGERDFVSKLAKKRLASFEYQVIAEADSIDDLYKEIEELLI